MKLIDLFQIMDLDELIIIRNISDNYHTSPNKFMKEHPDLCNKTILFQSVRYSNIHCTSCIMIRLSGLNTEGENKHVDC